MKNVLCNALTLLFVLKILHGAIHANTEPLRKLLPLDISL